MRANGRDRELTAEQLKYEEEIMMSFDAQAKEELRAQQEFDRRMLQAGENQELIKMVEEEFQDELTRIAKEGEDDRSDIVSEGTETRHITLEQGAKLAVNATQNMFGQLEALAGENEKQAQAFAITGVLLSQAVALGNAIAGASSAAAAAGPGAPFALAANIISMVGTVIVTGKRL